MNKRETQNELAEKCLHAILEKDIESIKKLLDCGLKPFSIYPSFSSPKPKQVVIRQEGQSSLFKKNMQKAITFVACSQLWDITELMIVQGGYPAKDITDILELAIISQKDSTVKTILKHGHFFVGQGFGTKRNIINYMLHYGEQYLGLFEEFHFNLYQKNNSSLFIALQKEEDYLFRYLLSQYYDQTEIEIISILEQLLSFEYCDSHQNKIGIFFNHIAQFPEIRHQAKKYLYSLDTDKFKNNFSKINNYHLMIYYINKINLFEKFENEHNNYLVTDESIQKI